MGTLYLEFPQLTWSPSKSKKKVELEIIFQILPTVSLLESPPAPKVMKPDEKAFYYSHSVSPNFNLWTATVPLSQGDGSSDEKQTDSARLPKSQEHEDPRHSPSSYTADLPITKAHSHKKGKKPARLETAPQMIWGFRFPFTSRAEAPILREHSCLGYFESTNNILISFPLRLRNVSPLSEGSFQDLVGDHFPVKFYKAS